MTKINAYISFGGNCREAMSFYQECLGGELTLQPIAGSPIEAQCPTSMKGYILHSTLTRNGFVLMASDMTDPEGYQKGNNIALSVDCSSEEEINLFFNSLSAGGKIIDPLQKQFWGALFGAIRDRYGIRWIFNYQQ